jgi:hypothetical protein
MKPVSSSSSRPPGKGPEEPLEDGAAFTVLVNSTDSYDDCWAPFATLFAKFWPHCRQRIVLNTETKDFRWPGLDLIASRVNAGEPSRVLPWGECLLRCLDLVDTEVILYLQEDYFLSGKVDVETLVALARRMHREGHDHISLTPFSTEKPWYPSDDPLLCSVDPKASFRINLQAGLWRKRALRRHLRRHENPWQFEVWGTKRSHRIRDSFLCVNPEALKRGEISIVPYVPTGIVDGQWYAEAVVSLFREHDIQVDFAPRGFHDLAVPRVRLRPWLGRRAWARLRSLI